MDNFKKFIASSVIPLASIAIIGFLVYGQCLYFDLTFLDDNVWVLGYRWLLKNPANILQFFLEHDLIANVFYRPMINMSFVLNALWGNDSLLIYHLTNIVIHIFNAFLLFKLFKKMGHDPKISFWFSLIFVVHPALTQAVVWIPGRTDSLLAFFVLLSFISFIGFLQTSKWFYYVSHAGFLILALLTKETAVVLPVICYLYHALIHHTKGPFPREKFVIGGWFVIVGGWLIIRKMILAASPDVPWPVAVQSLIQNLPAIISYVGKIVLPVNLSVLPILEDTRLIYGIIAILLLAFFVVRSTQRRDKHLLFGLLWFLSFLMPSFVLSFILHEYRLYLPIMGVMMMTLELDWFKEKQYARLSLILLSATTLIFSIMTIRYAPSFKDSMTFWTNAVRTSPHAPLAHRNLGSMYYLQQRLDEAKNEYQKALELNPQEPMVHNNLALIYMDQGNAEEAEKEYKFEVALNPAYDNVYYNLGVLCYRQKRLMEAEGYWKKTLELNPRYIEAYNNLLVLYLNLNDLNQASYYGRQLKARGFKFSKEVEELLKL